MGLHPASYAQHDPAKPRRARLSPEELVVFCEWCLDHSESRVYARQDLPAACPAESQFEMRCRHGDCIVLNDDKVPMVLVI